MFKNVANPNSTTKRTKRSVIAGVGITLGLGLVDLLFTGISDYKILKSHISRVEQKFDQFVIKNNVCFFLNLLEYIF